jgi:uncharacterized RDD family membrane protein YckC
VTAGTKAGPATTGLARRLAAMLYEGVLLFGVVMLAGLLYSTLTQQRHALQGRLGLQAFLFAVLAVYFVWFWTHGGQTVAMKTWRLRVVTADGRPLGPWRALARYVLAWLWFLPSLLAVYLSGLSGGVVVSVVLLAGMAAYAALTRLHPDRQFLHDVICGTRLVDAPFPPRPTRAP